MTTVELDGTQPQTKHAKDKTPNYLLSTMIICTGQDLFMKEHTTEGRATMRPQWGWGDKIWSVACYGAGDILKGS